MYIAFLRMDGLNTHTTPKPMNDEKNYFIFFFFFFSSFFCTLAPFLLSFPFSCHIFLLAFSRILCARTTRISRTENKKKNPQRRWKERHRMTENDEKNAWITIKGEKEKPAKRMETLVSDKKIWFYENQLKSAHGIFSDIFFFFLYYCIFVSFLFFLLLGFMQ